jgi:hypothetical protein
LGFIRPKILEFSRRGTGATLKGGRLPGFAEEVNSIGQAPVLKYIDGRLCSIV